MLTRRTVLQGVAAAAAQPAVSLIPAAAAAPVASPLVAFVVGTPGEYDGACVFATSAREAFRQWSHDQGTLDEDEDGNEVCERCDGSPCTCDHAYYAKRMKPWDNLKDDPTPADWMKAGMGYICDRCHNEQGFGDGYEVNGDAVCVDCMALADYEHTDPEGNYILDSRLFLG